MNSPLLPLFMALTTGVLLSRYIDVADSVIILSLLGLAFLLLLVKQRYAAILASAVAVGTLVNYVDTERYSPVLLAEDAEVMAEGTVVSVSDTESSTLIVVDLENGYHGRCQLTIMGGKSLVIPGQFVRFSGKLTPTYSLPDVDGDIDLSDYYYRNHISACAFVNHDDIEVVGIGNRWNYFFALQRERSIDAVVCSNLSAGSRQFLVAVLLGDDGLLDDSVRPRFATAGLSHVLALSGMHVAILAMLLSILLTPVTWTFNRRVTQMILIVGLWFYAFLTGLSPSVTRATIMLTMVLVAKIAHRHNSSLNALCLAAIVILVFAPRHIYAPGFQLSFVAVFMLIVLPSVLPSVSRKHYVAHYVYTYVVYTLSATIGTLPLVLYYFHQVPLFSLISNIPCAFLLPVLLGGGLVMFLLGLIGLEWGLIDWIIDWVYSVIDKTCTLVSNIPHAVVENVYLNWWEVVALYVVMLMVILCLKYRNILMFVSTGLVTVVAAGCILLRPQCDDTLFVARNNEATDIVYTQHNRAFLVSTGTKIHRRLAVDKYCVRYKKFLLSRNIGSIEIVDEDLRNRNFEIQYGNHKVLVLNSKTTPYNQEQVESVIVTAGFAGDILESVRSVKCDSIFLGCDIKPARRALYERKLDDAGLPYRTLSIGCGFSISR